MILPTMWGPNHSTMSFTFAISWRTRHEERLERYLIFGDR